MDDLFAHHDLKGAERLLDYWLAEALAAKDKRSEIQIRNEQLGLFRRTDNKQKGLATAQALLPLLGDQVWEGTILLNIATNYCHFGMPDAAEPLYARVQRAYSTLADTDIRLAGLYNNMAAKEYAQKRYAQAAELYTKALAVQQAQPERVVELGISYVNRATCLYWQNPLDEAVDRDMRLAFSALMEDYTRDGYYAFVLSKVLPAFAHLGYAEYTEQLNKRRLECEQNYR